jgi:hypothetical protein
VTFHSALQPPVTSVANALPAGDRLLHAAATARIRGHRRDTPVAPTGAADPGTRRCERETVISSLVSSTLEATVTFLDGGSSLDEFYESELLPPDESLDDDEVGTDVDEGYSPAERPWGLTTWGITEREEAQREDLDHRLAREEPDVSDAVHGDGIGDTSDSDGEPIDDQVGDLRSGRLVLDGIDGADSSSDYRAHDVGVDGAGASAEEAAVHVVPDDYYGS